MPLTTKGTKIMENMQKEYGEAKGKSVFYGAKNKGTISGVDASCPQSSFLDACRRGDEGGIRRSSDNMLRGRMIR